MCIFIAAANSVVALGFSVSRLYCKWETLVEGARFPTAGAKT